MSGAKIIYDMIMDLLSDGKEHTFGEIKLCAQERGIDLGKKQQIARNIISLNYLDRTCLGECIYVYK